MALKNILDKILKDAQTEVTRIQEQASTEMKNIQEESAKQVQTQTTAILNKAKEQAQHIIEQKTVEAELVAKKQLLQAKQEVLEQTFESAAKSFCALEEAEYKTFIKKSLLSLITTGEEEIIFDKKDEARLDKEFLEGIQRNLKVSFDTTKNIQAGFILISNKVRIDYSIKAILNNLRSEIEAEIAKILFEQKG